MAKSKKVADAILSGVKTPAQMKAEMAVDRARNVLPQAEREANLAQYMQGAAIPDNALLSSPNAYAAFARGFWPVFCVAVMAASNSPAAAAARTASIV